MEEVTGGEAEKPGGVSSRSGGVETCPRCLPGLVQISLWDILSPSSPSVQAKSSPAWAPRALLCSLWSRGSQTEEYFSCSQYWTFGTRSGLLLVPFQKGAESWLVGRGRASTLCFCFFGCRNQVFLKAILTDALSTLNDPASCGNCMGKCITRSTCLLLRKSAALPQLTSRGLTSPGSLCPPLDVLPNCAVA